MLPPRKLSPEVRARMAKEELEGVALAFPDSGSSGNTNTGNAGRRCLMKEYLRERLVGTVPEQERADYRFGFVQFCILWVKLIPSLNIIGDTKSGLLRP